jgi:hypothetical protein
MNLFDVIKQTYPEINDSEFISGSIELKDDGDGIQYLAKWDYSKPIPEGLSLGKPNA